MFKVVRNTNRIQPLVKKRFSDLGFKERDHIQEWLVYQPDALGEELLIIQKEFDGFDDTRERLDLLALDKKGNLVVIENKLDDSGRDVVWQSLKYTAYVSSLKKIQIIEIYQDYLNRYEGGGVASEKVCEFLEIDDIDPAVLNSGNSQRIMLIAARFRKEVTATVLWLISRGIVIQCFKITPYSMEKEVLIDIDQIIPPPEASDYMIGISSKDNEEATSQGIQKERHQIRVDFWAYLLDIFKEKGVELYANVNTTKDHWLNAGSGLSGCPYTLVFGKTESRVELNFLRTSTAWNKWMFDRFYQSKSEIENKLGMALEWKRLDNKKSSKISISHQFDGFDKKNWPKIAEWMADIVVKIKNVMQPFLEKYGKEIKSVQFEDTIDNEEDNANELDSLSSQPV
ncbi:DUF4268 domain-containing protein [Brytella acorum]|uniref:DUF4268 domain-containing protein n=1 Tax=Brytella acorum TaxID=2959299 RepID=A0AA35Y198_9PROT|nr:DUF4268 domain-containing protein [Brytella acorum]MDF3626262.1 DUF4268 domain-containing protein [Brytella acorum]CAI9120404.1 DUF4268 domain-containing protein [Brytella acorum]